MAGENIIGGAQPVEWAPEEGNFADGTTTESVSWNWFGIGTSWSVTEGVESESITYLPEFGASNKLEKRMNVKHREMWEGEITYHPQNWDLLKHFTGSDGGTSDDPDTIQVGMVNESPSTATFARMLGGMGEEITISGGEDETFEVTGSFIFADGEDFASSDYVDDANGGAHASENTTEPFKWSDVANVQYGGSDISGAIESLEISISNDVAVVRDPDSTLETLIVSLVPVTREITVSMDITYSDFSMMQEVRAYQPQDLTFDIGSTSFTITGVQFPEAPYEFTPEDLVSDSVDSDPASSITWTTTSP